MSQPRIDAVAGQQTRSRSKLRRFLLVSWILLCMIGSLGALELFSRRLLTPWHQEVGNRYVQPYLMSGGYFQTPVPGVREENIMTGSWGPAGYGYSEKSGMYIYGFDKAVLSIADRGDFLFQDRVHLANDLSRNGVTRIFVIGGSAAYGIGASSKETRWYAVLERALSTTLAREVRLIPAAMIGYVSTQERLVLDLMVLPRQPDAVIIFDGFNDAALPMVFGNRPGDPYDQGILYEDFYSPFFGLKKWAAQYSHLYRYLLHRSFAKALEAHENRILENSQLLTNYATSTASVYLDNVGHMLEVCKYRGIPCMAFLQPVRDLTWRSQGLDRNLDLVTLRAYDEILNGIPKLTSGNGVYDLTGIFNETGREQWYMDNVHFKDPGHKAVAEAMYPIVLEVLREKHDLSSQEGGR